MLVWPGAPAADGNPGAEPALPLFFDPSLANELEKQRWYGKANRLSPEDPVRWAIIDEVAAASRKPNLEPQRLGRGRRRAHIWRFQISDLVHRVGYGHIDHLIVMWPF